MLNFYRKPILNCFSVLIHKVKTHGNMMNTLIIDNLLISFNGVWYSSCDITIVVIISRQRNWFEKEHTFF